MIVLIHNNKNVIEVLRGNQKIDFPKNKAIGRTLIELSITFPKEIIIWCNQNLVSKINYEAIPQLLHHDKMILFYNVNKQSLLLNKWGYVDDGSVLKINEKVSYFSWQIASSIGVANTKLIQAIASEIKNKDEDFQYLLFSIGKRAMPNGLFCNSEPKLLLQNKIFDEIEDNKFSYYTLFKFIKQHKPFKWQFVLLFNFFVYEKKFLLLPFIYALFFRYRDFKAAILDNIVVNSSKQIVDQKTIDVIIPTIGRKTHVHNVLKDLNSQTILPKKVIIVEQNPIENSTSELDFIVSESWSFTVELIFTNQTGVCNARNIALSKVTSEWVFMCDDDNRFQSNLIEHIFSNAKQFGVKALLTVYLQGDEVQHYNNIHQTAIFGSGNSFLKTELLENVSFDSIYEFCYGEDFDFGMQIRKKGVDVVYFPKPSILHLKAQIGGFRTKFILKWDNDIIKPKPSPTITLNYLKYRTNEQLNAYKTIYYFGIFKNKGIFKFLKEYKAMELSWKASLKWAKKLQS